MDFSFYQCVWSIIAQPQGAWLYAQCIDIEIYHAQRHQIAADDVLRIDDAFPQQAERG
jgi:hypothetical protein